MKNFITLYVILIMLSCSSSDDSVDTNDNNGGVSVFNIELSANNTAVVDEVVALTVTSNEPMVSLEISFDNFQTSTTSFSDLGSSVTRYFSFDKLGTNTTIYFKSKNSNGDESVKTYTPSISRGNAVKITSIQVVSFFDIDNTWDSGFPNTDVNHLADVFFHLRKPQVSISQGNLGFQDWFTSVVKENQGDLTWDVSSEGLYLDPQLSLQYSMADDDGSVNQDLMLGPPFEREVTFAEHIATQPSTITLSDSSINLEVIFTIEWN